MNPKIIHIGEGLDIEAIRRVFSDHAEVHIVDSRASGIAGAEKLAGLALVDAARAGDRIRELVAHYEDGPMLDFYDAPKSRRMEYVAPMPKPPTAIQDAIKAKADTKRAARNAKRLANAGKAS